MSKLTIVEKDHGYWHLTDWEADEELEDFLWQ